MYKSTDVRHIPTTQFELFDNIADLLEAMYVGVLSPNRVSYHLQHTHTTSDQASLTNQVNGSQELVPSTGMGNALWFVRKWVREPAHPKPST